MKEMTPRDGRYHGFEHTEVVADGITSEELHIPPLGVSGGVVAVTLVAGANTGKIQYTTSTDDQVAADTAVWQDWALGVQTGTVTDTIVAPVNSIRCVSVSGEISYEVLI